MHRIDEAGATVDNRFQTGNPSLGQPATRIGAAWPNAVQEEIISVLTAAGMDPEKGVNTQLRDAIVLLIAGGGADLSGLLAKAGGTMTGDLVLAGNADNALEAVPKQQLDAGLAAVAALIPSLAGYLALAGGTMTGALLLHADPGVALGAAPKQYVDARVDGVWVEDMTSAADSTTDAIDDDDTIPQISEGKQFASRTLTLAGDQRAEIVVTAHIAANDRRRCVALFCDGGSDAIAVGYGTSSGGSLQMSSITLHVVHAPGAGVHTYTARYGTMSGGTVYLNASDTAPTRLHGGVCKSGIRARAVRGA